MMVSSKQRIKPIIIGNELEKILLTYRESLKEEKISYEFINAKNSFTIETIDAVIYQTFSNLIDNAIYWLNTNGIKEKKIMIQYNKDDSIVFADSGPGVSPELAPYIFDRFVSGKGLKGRGLGLYISKRLLNKYDFDIRLANESEKITNSIGANFIIDFKKEH
jgi:signal transduction histidine kinase